MSALEAELLFARSLLLLLLYGFLGAVAWLTWRELRGAGALAAAEAPTGAAASAGGAAPARLIVVSGGASERPPGTAFPLSPVARVGRDIDNDVVLRDPSLSAHHAVLTRRDGTWWLEDLASTNGSWVNGESLPAGAPQILRSGDLLQLGAIRLRLVHHERD